MPTISSSLPGVEALLSAWQAGWIRWMMLNVVLLESLLLYYYSAYCLLLSIYIYIYITITIYYTECVDSLSILFPHILTTTDSYVHSIHSIIFYTTMHYSPIDSPSRQLVFDLARDLERVRIHSFELKKVKAYERRSFYENLEQIDRDREAEHYAALDHVARQHDKVREEAQDTLNQHLREVEAEHRRKEEEARKERERIERERAEEARRQQEEAARQEAERKAKEDARKRADEYAEKVRKAEKENNDRRERERLEEENRKHEKEQQDIARRHAESTQKAQAERQKQGGVRGLTDQESNVHKRYLDLHQHLKKFREYMRNEGKSNPSFKQNMGDMRRTITKCCGQLREGKGANIGQV